MRIHRITLCNYAGVDHAVVSFDTCGVTVIEGDNESGKSTIVDALDLLLDRNVRDRSSTKRTRLVRPVHRDANPHVEADISTGPYRFVFSKRWGKTSATCSTTLDVTAPRREQLTGDEAHDRAYEILDETLDASLLRALQVYQGTELLLPAFGNTELGAALDATAGDVARVEGHDDLWTAIEAEYNEYWTPTGRSRAALAESQRRVEDAESDVASLEVQLREIEIDADAAARLADDAERLAEAVVESNETRDEYRRQVEAAEALENDLQSRQAELDRADDDRRRALDDQQQRTGLVGDLERRQAALAELNAQAEQSAPVLTAAQRHRDAAETDWNAARQRLDEVQQASTLADRDREHLRQIIEARQFRERHQRLLESQRQLDAADAVIETIDVTDDDISQIESAERTLIAARAAAQAGSATVTATALSDVALTIDGEALPIAQGDQQVLQVAESMEITVPDMLRLSVVAGVEARQLASDVAGATADLRRLCELAGVAGLAGARLSRQRRVDAERERHQAREAMKRDLADLTTDEIASRAERLAARVAAYAAERVAEPPLPADERTATRAALDLHDELEKCQAQFDSAEDARHSAREALHSEEKTHAALGATIEAAQQTMADAEQRLTSARDQVSDDELTKRVASTDAIARDAETMRNSAQSLLEASDIDSLRSRLSNAEAAADRARAQQKTNRERHRELLISLELRGERGLGAQLDATRGHRDQCVAKHRSLNERASAAKLLRNVFERRRAEAQQRYRAPYERQVEQFGRIVYDSSFEVEVNDDLGIARRALAGVTLDVNQLSTGAREQLGIIARLACAAIVSPDGGGAPVILDDALGWSDPSRLPRMGAAIAAASRDCQVIILTCTPSRYAHVGTAKVVSLPTSPRPE